MRLTGEKLSGCAGKEGDKKHDAEKKKKKGFSMPEGVAKRGKEKKKKKRADW